jgi:formate/nitrite transporter FocA (FNT family)
MTDIQARLADINDRARKAQQQRDRYFWRTVTAIWLISLGIVITFVSIPMAREQDHIWTLVHQEQVASRR